MGGLFSTYLGHFTYLGLFVALVLTGFGFPFPEDIPLLTAGILAHEGVVRLKLAIPLLYLGVISGDLIVYGLGRQFGETLLRHRWLSRILHRERHRLIEAYFARYGNRTIFFARHLPGIRVPIFFTAGAMQLSARRFILWDGLGALLSVPLLTSLGYLFSAHVDTLRRDLSRVEHWLVTIVLLGVFVTLLLLRYRRGPMMIDPQEGKQ